MPNPDKHQSQFADANSNALLGAQQSNVIDVAAATALATEAQASATLTVTNAINTIAAVNGSGATSTQEGEIDALFAEVKVDLDANKVVVDRLVVESTDYKATIDALIVDVALMRTACNAILDVLEEHGLAADA